MGSVISLSSYYEELEHEWCDKQRHRKYLLIKQIEQSDKIKLKKWKEMKFIL